jgi:hypothetical protein
MEPLTLPVNEFARVSGLGISTIWSMVRNGQLESVAIGRRRLVVIESYRRMIDEQREAPVAANPAMPRGRPRQKASSPK